MYFLTFATMILLAAAYPFLPASVPLWVYLLVPFVLFWIFRAIIRRIRVRRLEAEVAPLIARYEESYGSLGSARRGNQAQQLVANIGEGFGEGYAEASAQSGDLWGLLIGVGVSAIAKMFGEYQHKTPEQRQLEAQITELLTRIRVNSSRYRFSVVGAGLACLAAYVLTEGGTFPIQRLTTTPPTRLTEADREIQACDKGDGAACLVRGRNLTQDDPSGAVRLFALACNHGNGEGCFALGESHEHGKGTNEDAGLAIAAYQHGCEKAHGAACEHLGILYRSGKAATQDRAGAITALEQACSASSLVGCSELARILLDGHGNRVERKRGVELLRRACKGAEAQACSELARYTKKQRQIAPAGTLLADRKDPPEESPQPAPKVAVDEVE